MKALSTIFLLALIPTFLFSIDARKGELYGIWYDDYSDTKLEIKHSRKGIKVKSHHGIFHKWRTYNYMGRGLYDDCDGRVIIALGPNRIEWRKGYRGRRITLTRYDRYGGFDRYNDYNRYDDRGYSNYDRRSNNRGYNTNRYAPNRYSGDWYCSDRGLNLNIEIYGNGFRARSGKDWTYYEPYEDHYRDRKGNRYFLDDRRLTWQSNDGKRKLRFGKR